MTIDALIDKQDNLELVRVAVANILATETASQQALATAGSKDPRLWTLRVFEERERPWTEWIEASHAQTAPEDVAPIVCVRFDSDQIDRGSSDPVERQTYDVRFILDCYGYGVSQADGSGHKPGDKMAADAAHRAARLVRNILMAAEYTYLSMRGVVGRRLVTNRKAHHEEPEPAQNVSTVRLNLDVRLVEISPQIPLEEIGGIDIDITRLDYVTRADTGEVIAEWSVDADP